MKAVIFDIGNVLVEYSHPKTLETVAEGAGCTVEDLRRISAAFDAGLTVGDCGVRQLYDAIISESGVAEAGATFDYDDFLTRLCAGITRDDEALAYAVELQNRAGTTVGAISNTLDGHVIWLDEHLPELKELDLVMMSNEVFLAKPDPAIYLLALEQLNLPAEQTIFVDDLDVNVRAAEAVGMAGIVHKDWAVTRPQIEAWLAS